MPRQVLHVDCDCFFAAVEMRDNPSYRDIPLAIGGSRDRRGVISTCNYAARAYGVRSAMPSGQALKLCPDLTLIRGDMEKYRRVSREVMVIVESFGLAFEQVSIDEAYIEIPPHSPGRVIAQQIRQQVEAEVGITVSVGIAPNKYLAKVASDWNKPNGQFVVEPASVESFVRALPVRKIPGVGPKSAEKLSNMGIHNCADVQEIELADLLKRFGQFGKKLYDRSRGIDERALSRGRERKSLSVERTFANDLESEEELQLVANDLWQRFQSRIEASNIKLRDVTPFVKVKFADFQVTTLANHQKTVDLDSFIELIQQARQRQDKPIRLIGIGARLKQNLTQMELFDQATAVLDMDSSKSSLNSLNSTS